MVRVVLFTKKSAWRPAFGWSFVQIFMSAVLLHFNFKVNRLSLAHIVSNPLVWFKSWLWGPKFRSTIVDWAPDLSRSVAKQHEVSRWRWDDVIFFYFWLVSKNRNFVRSFMRIWFKWQVVVHLVGRMQHTLFFTDITRNASSPALCERKVVGISSSHFPLFFLLQHSI